MHTLGNVPCQKCGVEIPVNYKSSKPKWCPKCKREKANEKAGLYRQRQNSNRVKLEPLSLETIKTLLDMGKCPCCGQSWK